MPDYNSKTAKKTPVDWEGAKKVLIEAELDHAKDSFVQLITLGTIKIGGKVLRRVAVLNTPGGSQSAPASFVRRVRPGEKIVDLIQEGKAATWVANAEHAIVSLEGTGPGRIQRVIVSGGRDGIEFIERDGKLFFTMQGQEVQVRRVIGHTHPIATGPSQGDLNVMSLLGLNGKGQSRTYIIEIGGDPGGTLVRPK